MDIKLATINDLDEIYSIFLNAIKRMNAEGNTIQWQTNDGLTMSDVSNLITSKPNECYKVLENDEIVGFFRLVKGIDETYLRIDGKWDNEDEYVTIHKIVVRYVRRGIASYILNFIIDSIKEQSINNIRIDTHSTNRSMKAFLNDKGFKYCGVISINNDFSNLHSLREAYIYTIKPYK